DSAIRTASRAFFSKQAIASFLSFVKSSTNSLNSSVILIWDMFLHLRFILFANFIITEREKHVSFCGFFNLHHYTDITKSDYKEIFKQQFVNLVFNTFYFSLYRQAVPRYFSVFAEMVLQFLQRFRVY